MLAFALFLVFAQAQVSNSEELRNALARAKPGDRIRLAPGNYDGGISVSGIRGEAKKPIVVCAADSKNPPVIRGGATGIHLASVAHLELRDLVIEDCRANGINIDDGGKLDTPSRGIVLENIKIARVGPGGNCDGIKLSGVDEFRVASCTVEGWGTGGGSAIDMVGCHDGVVESNNFLGASGAGESTSSGNGVQTKGGSANIVIRRNRFENAGARAINIGGSTGRQYFRPPLDSAAAPENPAQPKTPTQQKPAAHAEARKIVVEGNTMIGSDAAIAFVGVDGATVRFNTIYRPRKWAIRILQETNDPDFAPCRGGAFTGNIVVFDSARWSEGGVNIGPNTEPASFTFAENLWYCADAPDRSRPKLPTPEKGGVYGTNPQFRDAAKGDLRLAPDSPFEKIHGPGALK